VVGTDLRGTESGELPSGGFVARADPAQAASEIRRLMNAGRHNDIPGDNAGRYREIELHGAACEAVVDATRE
jgi:hypothetical protein